MLPKWVWHAGDGAQLVEPFGCVHGNLQHVNLLLGIYDLSGKEQMLKCLFGEINQAFSFFTGKLMGASNKDLYDQLTIC
jgi:hypothetical protein